MMPTVTQATAAAEAVKQRLGSGLQQFEERIREGRRAIVRGRHAAEDGLAAAVLQVRRRPLKAVAVAATAGALLGCVIGFLFGRQTRS